MYFFVTCTTIALFNRCRCWKQDCLRPHSTLVIRQAPLHAHCSTCHSFRAGDTNQSWKECSSSHLPVHMKDVTFLPKRHNIKKISFILNREKNPRTSLRRKQNKKHCFDPFNTTPIEHQCSVSVSSWSPKIRRTQYIQTNLLSSHLLTN